MTQNRSKPQDILPDFIFEVSWEVCNKVGGIYTVLATRARTLQQHLQDSLVFIGPDLCQSESSDCDTPIFEQDDTLFAPWQEHLNTGVIDSPVRVGRWNIPGRPIAILVDFKPYASKMDTVYYKAWHNYGVDSLHAYGDYDEASTFAYAAGRVAENFYNFYLAEKRNANVIYQAHEWMTCLGALYLRTNVPQIATIFTTHATSIGRSIAGNNKPLYEYFDLYDGDQMARELNMEAKHSIEKQTAHNVDCFTTVSDITNRECRALLNKAADVVLKNGFENDFVPKRRNFSVHRHEARTTVLRVASKLMGTPFADDTIIVGTSGRYEFRNKGIDVFLQSLDALNKDSRLDRTVLGVVTVPAWVAEARQDLLQALAEEQATEPLPRPFITHNLHNEDEDRLLCMLRSLSLRNSKDDKVKLLFIPCYLDGNDGIINKTYYDTLIGFDITVYPSYYEPWGYTPLESIAFHIPTITTELSGFGLWARDKKECLGEERAVNVIERTDSNYFQAADDIKELLLSFSQNDEQAIDNIRHNARELAKQALWRNFIKDYYKAYRFALENRDKRLQTNKLNSNNDYEDQD